MALPALRRRMLEDLQRRGLAPRTQPCALEAVTHLAHHDRRAPDHLSAAELRPYCLSWLNEQQVAERTGRSHRSGIRFFDERTRQRPWPVFARIRPRHRQPLPVVLSPPEVRSLLALVQRANARRCRPLSSAGGLRLREGTPRQVAAIAPPRMLVRVRPGQGGNDRVGPLAERTLERWRVSWQRERPRPWRFPARHQQTPLPATTLQKTFTRVVRQSGLAKDASIHTLRHAYATQLWERGVSWRVIQALRGHKRPSTTARDTPLTTTTVDVVHATINALRADLAPLWGTGMPAVADVCRCDGPADQARCGADLRPSHRRARAAILPCRTEALGGHLWPCDHGGQAHDGDHSCRHRRGPTCHRHDPEGWLAARRQERLPVPSVPVVLTLPQALRPLVRQHPPDLDDSLIRAAAQSLITRAADPHDVGGLVGVLGVLHPWPRALASHPPGHGLVPAGGVAADHQPWRPARQTSLVPVRARANMFRGRFCALVHQERPDLNRPEAVWTTDGVVYGQPTVPGTARGLDSWGRYGHRIAWTNSRMRSSDDGRVCVR